MPSIICQDNIGQSVEDVNIIILPFLTNFSLSRRVLA
jgi:hypothetical protein